MVPQEIVETYLFNLLWIIHVCLVKIYHTTTILQKKQTAFDAFISRFLAFLALYTCVHTRLLPSSNDILGFRESLDWICLENWGANENVSEKGKWRSFTLIA